MHPTSEPFRGTGTVHLVGAGPGDPELLTLKARRLIGEADAVVYDYLVDPAVLADARPDCELVFAGKKGGRFACPQAGIEATLIALAREGKNVVRLKGGDPFIFGRGGEEAAALAAAGVPFEIVPGVTAALAAAACAGIPLTHRAHSSAVVFLTGHEDPAKPGSAVRWEDYARLGATLCIYMGRRNLATIARRLEAGGMAADTPAVIVQAATTADHRSMAATLGTIATRAKDEKFESPAMVIIGEVAGFAELNGGTTSVSSGSESGTGFQPVFSIEHGLKAHATPPLGVASIVADRIRETIGRHLLKRPSVIVVDHGSRERASAQVRDEIAAQVRAQLGSQIGPLSAASMESPTGPEFAFNHPLYADQLKAPGFDSGDIVIAPLFLAPGRHAGPGGDLERIARAAEAVQPDLRCHFTGLVGTYSPASLEKMEGRPPCRLPSSNQATRRSPLHA